MREVDNYKIYRQIAKTYDLPLDEVEKAAKHQFHFVHHTMKQGNFEAVRLPYFGKFWAKKSRIAHLNKKQK